MSRLDKIFYKRLERIRMVKKMIEQKFFRPVKAGISTLEKG